MIESAPSWSDSLKKLVVVLVSFCVLGLAAFYLYGMYRSKTSDCVLRTKDPNPVSSCVTFEIVDTKESRQLGLSGRDSIESNKAMLFVYDAPGKHCMWMKDMKFNIDMVWLDANKNITKVERGVSPKTYPKSFCGGTKDKYVIETSEGAVDSEQLRIGTQLKF